MTVNQIVTLALTSALTNEDIIDMAEALIVALEKSGYEVVRKKESPVLYICREPRASCKQVCLHAKKHTHQESCDGPCHDKTKGCEKL